MAERDWVREKENILVNTLRSLIGDSISLVEYYYDDKVPFSVFEGLCDVCDYGIGLETEGGGRYKIVNAKWIDGNEGGVFLESGYVEEEYPLEGFRPIRRSIASGLPHWKAFLHDPIVKVELTRYSEVVFSTSWAECVTSLLDNPRDIEIELLSGNKLFFISGFYSPENGFEYNDYYSFVICFSAEARARVISLLQKSGPKW